MPAVAGIENAISAVGRKPDKKAVTGLPFSASGNGPRNGGAFVMGIRLGYFLLGAAVASVFWLVVLNAIDAALLRAFLGLGGQS